MKKIFIMAFLMLTFAFHMSAQTDYRELLVRDDRTYWATAASLFDPIRHFSESGMWFDKNGEFERYYVSFENDTMTTKDYAYDIEVFVSHRTYELHQDTILIKRWPSDLSSAVGPREEAAYKILYITEQKMLLLPLTKNKNGDWVEDTAPPHHTSFVTEYRYMKPQDSPTK